LLYHSLLQLRSKGTHEGDQIFAQYVESVCESDKFEGFDVINRIVNPAGAYGWAIVKNLITKPFLNGFSLDLKGWK
tara:strand:+ start:45 stop:272 length:228 start_codon:yes stop_codon:yes gene_type:complete